MSEPKNYLLPGEKKQLSIASQLEKDFHNIQKSKAVDKELEKDSLEDLHQRMENLEPQDIGKMTNVEREQYDARKLVNEEFEQMYKKEKMLKQKIIYEKQCMTCKIIAGTLFLGGTVFHGFRIS